MPLHAMVASVGYSRERSAAYDWDGIRRGNAEFVLFQYSLGGRGRLRYEAGEFDVLPGQAMLLHFPHNNRYWLPRDSTEWRFIYVCLYGSEVMRIWREMELHGGPIASLDRESPVVSTAARIVDRVVHGGELTAFESSRLAYQLTMDLAGILIPPAATPARDFYRTAIDAALGFCEKNYRAPISVDDLALAAGYSRYHFTRVFTEVKGVSPKEYLQRLRIGKAVALLQSTRSSVKQIARESGFSDVNYFCRVFRKVFAVSPAGLRKSGMFQASYPF